ncbi:MAG: sulfur carrier protein ThiS [Acidobacteria bacterium]|nr:sulfur carrier protein ThiS [Acidobacteriota bacterium]MCH8946048.1 sulfur carrier protein ThiS [Acidobacteriota bacterium]
MPVTINGEARDLPDELTLDELLQFLELTENRVAIEHNREIVKRDRWTRVRVAAGDRLEIVHFVGGG